MAELFGQGGSRGIAVGAPGNMVSGQSLFEGPRQALAKLNEMQQKKDQDLRERKERKKAADGTLDVLPKLGIDLPDGIEDASVQEKEAYIGYAFQHLVPMSIEQKQRQQLTQEFQAAGIKPGWALSPGAMTAMSQQQLQANSANAAKELAFLQHGFERFIRAADLEADLRRIKESNQGQANLANIRNSAPTPMSSSQMQNFRDGFLGQNYSTPDSLLALGVPPEVVTDFLNLDPVNRGRTLRENVLPYAIRPPEQEGQGEMGPNSLPVTPQASGGVGSRGTRNPFMETQETQEEGIY